MRGDHKEMAKGMGRGRKGAMDQETDSGPEGLDRKETRGSGLFTCHNSCPDTVASDTIFIDLIKLTNSLASIVENPSTTRSMSCSGAVDGGESGEPWKWC